MGTNRKPLGPIAISGAFVFFAICGLGLYHRSLGAGLLSDDFGLLGRLRSDGFFAAWGLGNGGFFRPLTVATFWLDSRVWGDNAAMMHVENVILHAANSTLVFLITGRVLRDAALGTTSMAVGAGLIFLAHPSHSEAVSWVSGRGDLLAAFFVLLCLLWGIGYLNYGRRALLAASSSALFAGLLCKESALAAPGMLAACAGVVWLIPGDRNRRTRVLALAGASLTATALYLAARYVALGALLTGDQGASRLAHGMGGLIGSFKRQVLRTVLPALDVSTTWPLVGFISIALLLVIGTGLVIRAAGRTESIRPFWITIAALALAYLAALVPVVGSRVSIIDSEGERFLYLATAPYAVAMACAAALVIGHENRGRSAGVLLYTLCAACAMSLQAATTRWQRAGEYARQTIEIVRGESRGRRILLLNLPDSYEGAFVLRNGIEEALASPDMSSSGEEAFHVDVLTRCRIDRDGVQARFRPSTEHPGTWHLEVAETGDVFRPRKRDPSRASEFDSVGHFFLSLDELANYSDVFLFEGHGLGRVDLP